MCGKIPKIVPLTVASSVIEYGVPVGGISNVNGPWNVTEATCSTSAAGITATSAPEVPASGSSEALNRWRFTRTCWPASAMRPTPGGSSSASVPTPAA